MKNKDKKLNVIGLRCPEPIMVIRKTLRQMQLNEIVLILADDPSTIRDIPKFCYFMKHTLLTYNTRKKPYQYLLKKGK